ncbi:MAG: Ig-like domain-containing protein [Rubripirellula sp.]|nr:Ig-like domain-containing protein [Rubripirellula sp.]
MSRRVRRQLRAELCEPRLLLAASTDASYVPGEVLIQFEATTNEESRSKVRGLAGAALTEQIHTPTMKADGQGSIERVTIPESWTVQDAIKIFESNPNVVFAGPNYLYETTATSNDPQYVNGNMWGMESDDSPISVGPNGTTNRYGSQAEDAWAKGQTGSSTVYVGIIDSGFQHDHPDLIDNAWTNDAELNGTPGVDDDNNGYVDDIHGYDFSNDDNTPYDDFKQDFHGTHVAGTVGATGGNGIGVAGVNWDVKMIPAKFLGGASNSTAGAIKALDYLTDLKTRHGINLVATNNSWGPSNGRGAPNPFLEAAIIRAANEEILFIVAAGNDAIDNDLGAWPNNFDTSNPVDPRNQPASYDAVISVASTTNSGRLSGFSQFGATTVDLGAPGQAITSTWPQDDPNRGDYSTISGTSMATPHVTGAAALFASQYPADDQPSAELIKNALLDTVTPTSSLSGKTLTEGRLHISKDLLATNKTLRTTEDIVGGFLILASDIIQGTYVDGLPIGGPTPISGPETDVFLESVVSSSGQRLDQNSPNPIRTTHGGELSANFDGNGHIAELLYEPAQDFNSENLPASVGEFLDEELVYTVIDKDPAIATTPTRSTATASIRVTPQNDTPIARTDLVSISNQDYVDFYGGVIPPQAVPTEDRAIEIPWQFLLQNDSQGPSTAADENTQFKNNDGALRIVGNPFPLNGSVVKTIVNDGQNIKVVPADDFFGEVQFVYTIEDRGINQDSALNEFGQPAAKQFAFLTTNATASITFEPENDAPQAIDRQYTTVEAVEGITASASISFTADELLNGGPTDQLNPGIQAAASDVILPAPFNEDNQALQINTISADGTTLTNSGKLTLRSGGTLDVNFTNGAFSDALYTPPIDFNDQALFWGPSDELTYTIIDDGTHVRPAPDTKPEMSAKATVTLTVTAANDLPIFEAPDTIDILERDDNQPTRINDFFFDISGGSPTAIDESFPFQKTRFEITTVTAPAGLMTQPPVAAATDFFAPIDFFPAPDQFGTAVYAATLIDNGTPNRSVTKQFTVNVRPVNDTPILDPTKLGSSADDGNDEEYSVANDGVITYTLREDNTQAGGATAPYFIPLNATATNGYEPIGLLDLFLVGPENESAALEGGSQVIELVQAGNFVVGGGIQVANTDRGGTLTPVPDPNTQQLIGFNYIPPADFNSTIGVDFFEYRVADNSTTGGETYDINNQSLIADRRFLDNRVELNLKPVNDRPEINLITNRVTVPEDSPLTRLERYASNISAGPRNTAFDENDPTTGQLLDLSIEPLDFAEADQSDYFSVPPLINLQNGQLQFQPAPNVFGDYEFEVTLKDRNRDGSVDDDALRGDLNTSIPETLTISVRPINDAPKLNPDLDPLSFTLMEDGTVEILITGDQDNPGLLDVFLAGPADGPITESDDLDPQPGGNQTVSMAEPLPRNSSQGGTITFDPDAATPRFVYRPRANFAGTDSFIYIVKDDGVSVDSTGQTIDDVQIASNLVSFEVLPVNDRPIFSGAANVQTLEDDGEVAITNWASNVQAGPSNAFDEINGIPGTRPQNIEFKFTQLSANTDLFVTPPSAIIDPITRTATLTFESTPTASGIATFEVILEDDGPQDSNNGNLNRSFPRMFQINVQPVNDPPEFDLANQTVSRLEDSGPFSVQQVINVSPGPADEASQLVTFDVLPLAPQYAGLFSSGPTITSNGVLRFTPARNQNTDNASGPAVIQVVGRDSAGAISDPKEFFISIGEVNDPPKAFSDSIDTDEDTILQFNEAVLKANDVDPDLQTNPNESVRVVMPADSFSLSGARILFDASTGTVTYDPTDALALQTLAPNQSLTDTFSYSLIDAAGAVSNTVTIAVNVAGRNDAPRVKDDFKQLELEGSTTVAVLDNDVDLDGMIIANTVRVILQPAFGSLTVGTQGELTYRPFTSFRGIDTFSYTVKDNLGAESSPAEVSVLANDSPVANRDATVTYLNEPILISVAENDFDPDGEIDLESIEIITQSSRGEVIPQDDGSVLYVPRTDAIGIDQFSYRISDLLGRPSNIASVDIAVASSRLQNPSLRNDVNDDGDVSPIDALLVINRLSREGVGSIPVLATDRGPDFFDTNGDKTITVSDALQVINALGRNGSSEGEQVLPPAAASGAEGESAFAELPDNLNGSAKITDESSWDHPFNVAINAIAEVQSDEDDDDEVTAAIDAALLDLS